MIVRTSWHFPCSAGTVWPLLCNSHMDDSTTPLFELGVPHPVECRLPDGHGGVGSERECVSDQGVVHQRILVWEPERRLSFRMEETDIYFKRFVRAIVETFDIVPVRSGVRVTRTTAVEVKGRWQWLKQGLLYVALKQVHQYVFRNWRRLTSQHRSRGGGILSVAYSVGRQEPALALGRLERRRPVPRPAYAPNPWPWTTPSAETVDAERSRTRDRLVIGTVVGAIAGYNTISWVREFSVLDFVSQTCGGVVLVFLVSALFIVLWARYVRKVPPPWSLLAEDARRWLAVLLAWFSPMLIGWLFGAWSNNAVSMLIGGLIGMLWGELFEWWERHIERGATIRGDGI